MRYHLVERELLGTIAELRAELEQCRQRHGTAVRDFTAIAAENQKLRESRCVFCGSGIDD
jgi:hypothetical protein